MNEFLLRNKMSPMLEGKVAIVTGGARGIGFSIAKELIMNGAKVVICSRTKSDLHKALGIFNLKKGVAFGIICDVSKSSECKKLIKFTLRKLNRIDILINNAGVYGPIGLFEKVNLREWKKAFEINLMGMVNLSQLVIPIMQKKGGGKIINLCGAGVGGSKTMPHFSAYFTSKAAIASFSEVLADELQEKNIQVNSISPGAVNTYLNDYLIKQGVKKAGKHMYEVALKQKKEGGMSPELAAQLVAFLSSDLSGHITGRLLSAKWNPPNKLKAVKLTQNLYKLRRIDQELYYEKQ